MFASVCVLVYVCVLLVAYAIQTIQSRSLASNLPKTIKMFRWCRWVPGWHHQRWLPNLGPCVTLWSHWYSSVFRLFFFYSNLWQIEIFHNLRIVWWRTILQKTQPITKSELIDSIDGNFFLIRRADDWTCKLQVKITVERATDVHCVNVKLTVQFFRPFFAYSIWLLFATVSLHWK